MDAASNPHSEANNEPAELARRWVAAWQTAGPALERIRRDELRALDTYRAIERLCCEADFSEAPWAPLPTSGLIEQQRWFMRIAGRVT